MKYRKEIDGLRAIAVLPVIFFHAGFEVFSGGFVGVDIFFTISGYLIASIIIEDIENKKFSLLNFYEKRARRIIPALYFVLFLVCIFATIIMLPSQLKDFGQSLLATIAFLSNVYFYIKTDYWAQSSEFLPLLHTWSLGVEEQFYFIFPIILCIFWRCGKRSIFLILTAIILISLIFSEWCWRNNANANFYLVHTRAWELLLGSISALIIKKIGVKNNNFLSFLGLVAILFAIFYYDRTTPFPSLYALVPVIGVMLLIIFSNKETVVAEILSIGPLVMIGLISYSAYLWHQPILALYRVYKFNDDISIFAKLVIMILTFAMAFFSYRYIERPFRREGGISRKFLLLFSLIPLLIFCLYGILMHASEGLKDLKISFLTPQAKKLMLKLNEQQIERAIFWVNQLKVAEKPFPKDSKYKILLLGDSLSEDLFVVGSSSISISQVANFRRLAFDDECAKNIITNGTEVNHNLILCSESLSHNFESELFVDSDIIIIASAWLSNAKYLEAMLDRVEFKDKKIIVYKSHAFSPISSLIMALDGEKLSFLDSKFSDFVSLNRHSRTMTANKELESIASERKIKTIDGFDAFCLGNNQCTIFDLEGNPYIVDQAHLSIAGLYYFEIWFSRKLNEFFENIKSNK